MIYAKNKDALAYKGIHPRLDMALEHITDDFMGKLRDGVQVDLDGDKVYCTRFTYDTLPAEECFFEAHRRYLDIHIMLEGEEHVDVSHPDDLTMFDSKGDFYAYRGESQYSMTLKPGDFLVVFPGDAHQIKVMVDEPKRVSKAVFKVLVDD